MQLNVEKGLKKSENRNLENMKSQKILLIKVGIK